MPPPPPPLPAPPPAPPPPPRHPAPSTSQPLQPDEVLKLPAGRLPFGFGMKGSRRTTPGNAAAPRLLQRQLSKMSRRMSSAAHSRWCAELQQYRMLTQGACGFLHNG